MNYSSSYFASQAVQGTYMHFVQKRPDGSVRDMRVPVIGSTTGEAPQSRSALRIHCRVTERRVRRSTLTCK